VVPEAKASFRDGEVGEEPGKGWERVYSVSDVV
jgi:hypothetical protein